MVQVHLVSGFLEGGKTTFINQLLMESKEAWKDTLIICCEEGVEEYSDDFIEEGNIVNV